MRNNNNNNNNRLLNVARQTQTHTHSCTQTHKHSNTQTFVHTTLIKHIHIRTHNTFLHIVPSLSLQNRRLFERPSAPCAARTCIIEQENRNCTRCLLRGTVKCKRSFDIYRCTKSSSRATCRQVPTQCVPVDKCQRSAYLYKVQGTLIILLGFSYRREGTQHVPCTVSVLGRVPIIILGVIVYSKLLSKLLSREVMYGIK